ARPGPPVPVDLDDDRRVAPRKRSARERRECLVRALGEDRVGGPVAQLPRDPDGERAVEARSVERGDGGATLEGERPVAGRRPVWCGSEDAEREPLLERRELPLEGPVQREPVARAPDHQNPWLHPWSATIVCTIRRRIRGSASASTEAAADAASDARSSSSPRMRWMAATRASMSPGGTRRPFLPSSTTSGIPPTDVAI